MSLIPHYANIIEILLSHPNLLKTRSEVSEGDPQEMEIGFTHFDYDWVGVVLWMMVVLAELNFSQSKRETIIQYYQTRFVFIDT